MIFNSFYGLPCISSPQRSYLFLATNIPNEKGYSIRPKYVFKQHLKLKKEIHFFIDLFLDSYEDNESIY